MRWLRPDPDTFFPARAFLARPVPLFPGAHAPMTLVVTEIPSVSGIILVTDEGVPKGGGAVPYRHGVNRWPGGGHRHAAEPFFPSLVRPSLRTYAAAWDVVCFFAKSLCSLQGSFKWPWHDRPMIESNSTLPARRGSANTRAGIVPMVGDTGPVPRAAIGECGARGALLMSLSTVIVAVNAQLLRRVKITA
ncbi:MAG: hypothetical protein H8E35_15885 [Ardenticatenia bacterium]|nr:hypothetical protein [Ardenticatenia bacterium]